METKTTWALDPAHSEIGFKVKHMMFTNVSGSFQEFEGKAETETESFENAQFTFTAKVDSITTGNKDRDGHLVGADFFDATSFPELTFRSSRFEKTSNNEFALQGDLTLHG